MGMGLMVLCSFLAATLSPAFGEDPIPFKLPPFEKRTLENGLTVYLMERHEVPLIRVSLVFRAGAAKDGDRSGLAYLTVENLFSGTKGFSKRRMEGLLESLGASYETYIDHDSAGVDLSFLSGDQDRVFPLLKEAAQAAVFPRAEFERRKKRLLLELKQEKERPAEVIEAYFRKFLFGRHGYGNPLYGLPSTVKKISSREAAAFYRTHYRPDEAALIVVGDFQTPAMEEKVRKLFGTWRVKKGRPLFKAVPLPVHRTSRVLLVNKRDAQETTFIIGTIGLPMHHPAYAAARVVHTILGGRFSSWLNEALRVEGGLTYGVESYVEPYQSSGLFAVSSFTAAEDTVRAVDLVLENLERFDRQGVDAETLSSAKRYLIGRFPSRFETLGDLADWLALVFIFGLDETYAEDFLRKVEGVTAEDCRKVMAEHWARERLQMVFIGPGKALRDRVKKYGRLFEKDIREEGY